MISHRTEFQPRDLTTLIVAPILVALGIAVILHVTARLGLLPSPRPALDTDRTIVLHQVDAARRSEPAEILLIGDSSCLMDVDAQMLSALLKRPVLNLGTLSFLDLPAYARLLAARPAGSAPRAVVLLMNPEALRRLGPEPHQMAMLNDYLAGRDPADGVRISDQFNQWTGVDIVSGRILARLLPWPLAGAYGAHYGFTRDLERAMSDHRGSAVDPGSESFRGSAEYRLAPTLAQASSQFRSRLPTQTKLFVGMTPVPEKFAGTTYPAQRDELLTEWSRMLKADQALITLPAVLPDTQFARVTHLRPDAVPSFTKSLADVLATLAP